MGNLRWEKIYVENIPIPRPDSEPSLDVTHTTERPLDAKLADVSAGANKLECEPDQRVCELNKLPYRGIAAVEHRVSTWRPQERLKLQRRRSASLETDGDGRGDGTWLLGW